MASDIDDPGTDRPRTDEPAVPPGTDGDGERRVSDPGGDSDPDAAPGAEADGG